MANHRELHAEMRNTPSSAAQALVIPLKDAQPAIPQTLIDPLIDHPGTRQRVSTEDERPPQ